MNDFDLVLVHTDGSATRLGGPVAIGRAPDRDGCDRVALDDPYRSASKNHVLLRPVGAGLVEVTDLASTNGTTVTRDGVVQPLSPLNPVQFVPPIEVRCGDAAAIAVVAKQSPSALPPLPLTSASWSDEPVGQVPPTIQKPPERDVIELPVASATRVVPVGGPSALGLAVRDLVVETNGRRRLDRVDLDARGGELIGILGTSGAGKSTLVKAIAGVDPAASGTVVLDGIDVYAEFDAIRHRIGYVPQDDILHPTLTVRETLTFAARLRLPASATSLERDQRVAAVIDELGLTHRLDARVDELSGGQRKRVNVAVELLTSPTLLILDEPTSGLDPGNERIAMELFRSLAVGDRVLLVVTHSTDSLGLCDRVILMGTGGVKVYDGAAAKLSRHFGGRALNEIFAHLERDADVESLRVPPLPAIRVTKVSDAPAPMTLRDRVRSADYERIGHQVHVLSERYIRLIVSDRRSSVILASQAAVIAVLMVAVFVADSFAPGPNASKSGNVLMALALASIYLGASNAIREVVKERPVLERERALGVSPVAYLASKLIPLGAFTMLQALVLVVVGTLRQGQPSGSATFLPPMTEILLIVAASGISALCLGLAISAASPTPDRAMTVLPVVLFAQLLLVGLIFPVSTIGVQQVAWLTMAYWSFAGAASTVDFDALYCAVPTADVDCVGLWSRSASHWLISYAALCVLGAAALFLAWRVIDRGDPAQRLAKRRHSAADTDPKERGAS